MTKHSSAASYSAARMLRTFFKLKEVHTGLRAIKAVAGEWEEG